MPPDYQNAENLQENFEDFFEMALCGYVIADAKGMITRANRTLAGWLGCSAGELAGKRFYDVLTIGGKIYYETHLAPLLRMQGFFDEVVLELASPAGNKLKVMVNGYKRSDKDGAAFIRYTILKASDRLQYEQNLQQAKASAENELFTQTALVGLREQLIAVLGHDLRNPLSAIKMALQLLDMSASPQQAEILSILKRSSFRISELVDNIMDFARTRLGEGIVLNRQHVLLQPVLEHVINEMQIVYPQKEIITKFELTEAVNCDADRIGQLVSNLLANAVTHGQQNAPVYVTAFYTKNHLKISVANKGVAIPEELHELLFTPFTRDTSRASQNGLGLGLYISAEIARAHLGSLTFTSDDTETCFSFDMDL